MFTDASFTFIGNGDTTGVVEAFFSLFVNPLTEATIELSKFPTSAVVGAFGFYDFGLIQQAGLIDAVDQNTEFVLTLKEMILRPNDLASSIGPFSVTQAGLSPFDTTEGTLDLTSLDNLTLTANVSSFVPEPSFVWPLAGAPAFGLVLQRFTRLRAMRSGTRTRVAV